MFRNWSTVSTKLTWSHYVELLGLSDTTIVNYYISIVIEQNLSVRELREIIKTHEYERLDDKTKLKLKENINVNKISDLIKNPIIINNSFNYEILSEKILQKLILEDITSFLKELGDVILIYSCLILNLIVM